MGSPDPSARPSVDTPAAQPSPAEEPGVDRILTIPNGITVVRLLCIPLFVWLLFGAGRQTLAAVLLGLLGATDWVDGYVARRYHQVSTVGKVLDPAADRILVGTAVVSIMVYGAVPIWFGTLTLVREVLIAGMTLLLASLGARRIDVLWVGKAGTFGLMWSYPAFLLSYGTAGWQVPFRIFAWVAGLGGLTLAYVAAIAYLRPARQALIEGRAGRRAGRQAGAAAEAAEAHAEAETVAERARRAQAVAETGALRTEASS